MYIGTRLKKILLANGLEGDMHPGQERFVAHGCPVKQCSLTAKPEDAATADLVLFNGHIWRPAFARPAHQIWALFMLESPSHTPSLADFDGQVLAGQFTPPDRRVASCCRAGGVNWL